MSVHLVRRLFAGLVVLCLALSGRGHHVLCHDHGATGGNGDSCCSAETSQTDGPVVQAEDVEHTCPVCHLGMDLPPEPFEAIAEACGEVQALAEPVEEWLRVIGRLTECPRGPPRLV